MIEQSTLVPQRRFKEFKSTQAWEQFELKNMGKTFTGLSGKTKDDFGHGSAEFVTYMNVFSNPISDTTMTENVEIDLKQNKLEYGDVLFTVSSETPQEVGMSSVWLSNRPNVYLNSFCFGYRPTVNVSYLFLAYLFRSDTVRKKMMLLAQGISRYNISKNKVMELQVELPNISEQEKIGSFFKRLDYTISLQQRKLEKIKALKAAYLSEMFPAKGEFVPKRRFSGFTQDWKQYQLGELGSVAMNKRIFKGQTSNSGEVPFYKIGTFGKKPDAFISKKLFEEYKAKFPYPEAGDILISAAGSIGRTVEYKGRDEYFQDSNIVWLKHDERLDNSFLKHFYSIVKWQGLEGSTIKRLYNKDILNTIINVPSLYEQQRIGYFFNQFDDIITLHQSKLEKLQNLKKAYLHEMFV